MEFDLSVVPCSVPHSVPFSRFGAYLAISYLPAAGARAAGLYLRTVHSAAVQREICRIDLAPAGDSSAPIIPTTILAAPTLTSLRLAAADGHVDICFADPKTLRIRVVNATLRLTFFPQQYDHAVRHPQGWEINSYSTRIRLALQSVQGELQIYAPQRDGSAEQIIVTATAPAASPNEFFVSEFQTAWPALVVTTDFSQTQQAAADEFQQWLECAPQVPERYRATRELAAYVQWSAVVAAENNFREPAMLMSKNWLTQVWSWDHCFNAMALSFHNPLLAWQQFVLPFAQQNAEGALPDCIGDTSITWNFTKPPLHGWALLWMLQRTQYIGTDQLQQIYQPLCRWTEWWLQQRDDNHNGIAQYNHGNDSGWDNCTLFDGGTPLETPELSAFLVLQMEALADIAQRLQQLSAAQMWQQRSQQLLKKMLNYFWRDEGFVAIDSGGNTRTTPTLLLLMPLVLGKRLPASISANLIEKLQQDGFLTAHGLASESTASADYRADSYWRGPIWAPAVLLIVSGLVELGEHALARTISTRFCDTVANNGMAENFDALSGAAYRDGAHTWTASVFLILANRLMPAPD